MLENKNKITSSAFGLWTSALFSDIGGYNPKISFFNQKTEFFSLLRELLNEGKVKFSTPNEFWSKGNDIWNAETETIIDYLLAKWPADAVSERDLSDYFYEIPSILWVDEQGRLHGS